MRSKPPGLWRPRVATTTSLGHLASARSCVPWCWMTPALPGSMVHSWGRNPQVACLQKTSKRRLPLVHGLAPALPCQHLCRCWKPGHGQAGPSRPPPREFGGPITCFTDQASPPRPTTGVDVPVGNQPHRAIWARYA